MYEQDGFVFVRGCSQFLYIVQFWRDDWLRPGYELTIQDMEKQPKSLDSTLRAFLAQGRCDRVDGELWEELAGRFLQDWMRQRPHVIQTAFAALRNFRSSVSDDRWVQFHETLQNHEDCHTGSEAGRALRGALQLLRQSNFSSPDFFPDGKRSFVDLTETDSTDRDCGPSKRPRVSKFNVDPDNRVESVDPKVSKSSPLHRPFYGFHLLSTEGIPCHGDAHVELTDVVAAGAELAIVFNYQFDMAWMLEEMPAILTCQKIMIVHGMSSTEELEWKNVFENYGIGARVRVVRPETPTYGTVHSKMFLLFYSTGCRVCIHTANMVASDWKMKTQGAYVRDFPLQSDDAVDTVGVECDFERKLGEYLLRSIRTGECNEIVLRLHKHDFSSAGVAIVSSVPGKHLGDDFVKYGHLRLRHLLSSETLDHRADESAVICQFSSLGSLRPEWLSHEFGESVSSQAGATGSESADIQFVYPTEAQVEASNEGVLAGVSIPVTAKNLHREHILTRLHRWNAEKSGRERAMPHIKTFVRYSPLDPQHPAWVFLGSFNLSVAAWGRITGRGTSSRRSKTQPSLQILSYEIGVLFTRHLSVPPTFALPDACVKYGIISKQDCMALLETRKHRVSLVLDDFKHSEISGDVEEPLNRTECSSESNAKWRVILPIPYSIPPKKYSSEDIGWTVNRFQTM